MSTPTAVSHAAGSVRTQVFVWTCFHFPGRFLGVELLGHVVSVWLTFSELADLLPTVATAFASPPAMHRGQVLEHLFPRELLSACRIIAIPRGLKGVPRCSFNLHFPTDR